MNEFTAHRLVDRQLCHTKTMCTILAKLSALQTHSIHSLHSYTTLANTKTHEHTTLDDVTVTRTHSGTDLVPGDGLHLLNDLGLLVRGVEVGHVAGVEDHADVLHEALVLDLVVREQEHRRLALAAALDQQLQSGEPTGGVKVIAGKCSEIPP